MSTSEDTGLLCEWLPPAESEGEEEEEAMFYAQERKVEGEVPLRLGGRHGQSSAGRRCRRRRALTMAALVIEQMWPHGEESDGQDGKGDNHLPGMGGT
ncbi:hypothetical protein TYRP_005982 [Tyrophagus putrescentiae]|nr:hypothetical protein TYRP_005982 [Tyrophagus putrescentiae]